MKSIFLPPALCVGALMLTAAAGPQPAAVKASQTAPLSIRPKIVPIKTARRVVRQKPRRAASPVVRHVAAATVAATQEPRPDAFINAVQVFPWSEGALYHVYTAPERVTDIALQPGEMLGAVAAGDTVRWVIGDTSSGSGDAKQTHVLIKPFAAGLSTNIVITTDRRSYHLALTSTARTAMTALSWTYPADQLIALRKAAEQTAASAPVSSGLSLDQLHFNYAISGDEPVWRPLRAFDDGRQTFIEFPASLAVSEAPPLFLVDPKGVTALVNYRVAGRFYVVDRIFDNAELRLGTKKQDIVRISRVAEIVARRRGA
jgi:P-type conjugative transfer protein TrbG